jgi:hypothetical protein
MPDRPVLPGQLTTTFADGDGAVGSMVKRSPELSELRRRRPFEWRWIFSMKWEVNSKI